MRLLGQTKTEAMLTTPAPLPTDYVQLPLPDGTLYKYPDGHLEVDSNDGSIYVQDSTGYWQYWGPANQNYIICWGDAFSGGWTCNDGSSGGDWNTSPAGPVKKKAKAAAAAAPSPTATAKTPATTAPATTTPAAPPVDPNDPVVPCPTPTPNTTCFQSGASYYEDASGLWTYIDAQGGKYTGDAAGNRCDPWGDCSGPDWGPQGPGNTWIYVAGGALVLLLVLMGGRRR